MGIFAEFCQYHLTAVLVDISRFDLASNNLTIKQHHHG